MSRETINLICAEFPGAEKSGPSGEEVWAVGGEAFARVEAVVWCRDAEGWAALPFGTEEGALRHRVAEAYGLVRRGLPEGVQVTLDRTSG